ncbi:MAG: glycosyltransferase [Chloroflexota bacterium]|nr:glycosyltransferase [Chloroflexota bacterium]
MTHSTAEAPQLVIVGFRHGTHVGGSFARAAARLGVTYAFVDAADAFMAPRLMRAASWRLRGRRPPALSRTSRAVASVCAEWRPRWLLSTGTAPIDAPTLAMIGRLGVARLNYLTDDPWNPALRAPWFLSALRHYDQVFSPRKANLDDLRQHGCATVSYLPFGYDPELCFRQEPPTVQEWSRYGADLAFVGGADRDRVPYLAAAIRTGVAVSLYGGYWDRFPQTNAHTRGHADVATVRKVTSAAKVSLCLVRRANRDGHVMRSLEIPAMGGCMLVEDTQEHRGLFGPPGHAATYFRAIPDMLEQLRWLLSAEDERRRLAESAERCVRQGRHTYEDRLRAMLDAATL